MSQEHCDAIHLERLAFKIPRVEHPAEQLKIFLLIFFPPIIFDARLLLYKVHLKEKRSELLLEYNYSYYINTSAFYTSSSSEFFCLFPLLTPTVSRHMSTFTADLHPSFSARLNHSK